VTKRKTVKFRFFSLGEGEHEGREPASSWGEGRAGCVRRGLERWQQFQWIAQTFHKTFHCRKGRISRSALNAADIYTI